MPISNDAQQFSEKQSYNMKMSNDYAYQMSNENLSNPHMMKSPAGRPPQQRPDKNQNLVMSQEYNQVSEPEDDQRFR